MPSRSSEVASGWRHVAATIDRASVKAARQKNINLLPFLKVANYAGHAS
jgi:hypothetical protein